MCSRSALARFSWAFHLTQEAGIPVDQSLTSALNATGNAHFQAAARGDDRRPDAGRNDHGDVPQLGTVSAGLSPDGPRRRERPGPSRKSCTA